MKNMRRFPLALTYTDPTNGRLATAYFNETLMRLGAVEDAKISFSPPCYYILHCTLPFPVTASRLNELLGPEETPVEEVDEAPVGEVSPKKGKGRTS